MTEPLRPSTLGEILDRTAQLYRRNFWLFAGTAAMPMVMVLALVLVAIPAGIFAIPGIAGSGAADMTTAIRGAAFFLAFLIVMPVYLALYVFAIAGITQATASTNRGERLTIRAALKTVPPRFWTYLWYLILQGLMAGFLPAIAAGAIIVPLIYGISQAGAAAGVALGFVVFLVGAAAIGVIVWLALSYSMGMAVCAIEKKTAWESLVRSYRLSEGTRGRIFLLFLLITVLSMAVSMFGYFIAILVAGVAALAGNGSNFAAAVAVAAALLYFVVSIAGQIVLQPVPWIALVLFYYDQRIRKEGFDIEWMMEQVGMTQAAAAPPGAGGIVSAPVTPPDTVEER
jgi:hypothetical protein